MEDKPNSGPTPGPTPGNVTVTLDMMLVRRKVKSKDLAAYVGITEANLSQLKSGKVKGVRFETLGKICAYLNCKPGDILDFELDEEG